MMWSKADHSAYSRERYAWLKAHGFCTACKQQDARTLAGRAYCERCAARYRRACKK